jgi:hypothetical protein
MRKTVSSLIVASLLVVGLGKAWGEPPAEPIRFPPFPCSRGEKQRFNCEDGLTVAIFNEKGWRMSEEEMKTAGIVDFACVRQVGGQVYVYTIKRAEHVYFYVCSNNYEEAKRLCLTVGFEMAHIDGMGLGKTSVIFQAR